MTEGAARPTDREPGATPLEGAGLDGVAVKPTEHDLERVDRLPVGLVNVDYEGGGAVPDAEWLAALARDREVRVTTPVRADGFDPLGDDSLLPLPEPVDRVLVAGNPAYLSDEERTRAVAPRLAAARSADPDAGVGTEGVERVALAAGGTQYDLLDRDTGRELRALRAAGFEGGLAVYAPVVFGDEDAALDAVGGYVARRAPVRRALPEGATTDARATGRARQVLAAAVDDYALVGSPEDVRKRVAGLREAGADRVVGYPARGLDRVLGSG